jgi:hypothetical protein
MTIQVDGVRPVNHRRLSTVLLNPWQVQLPVDQFLHRFPFVVQSTIIARPNHTCDRSSNGATDPHGALEGCHLGVTHPLADTVLTMTPPKQRTR